MSKSFNQSHPEKNTISSTLWTPRSYVGLAAMVAAMVGDSKCFSEATNLQK